MGWMTLIWLALTGAVVYIFMIRPQRTLAKQEKSFRDGLAAGARVMTAGGIHASYVKRDGNYSIVELAEGVNARVLTESLNQIPQRKK